MSNKTKLFEGTWITASASSDDYNIEYTIKTKGDDFEVTAKDVQVDEELEITDVVWKNNTLSFKSLIPSIERLGVNHFIVKSNGNLEGKFTFTHVEELKKDSSTSETVERGHLIEGRWVSVASYDENEYLTEYIIKATKNNFSIKAKFLLDGEKKEITNIKWDGEILSFMSFMPSTRRSGFNQFKINSIGNIDAKFTFTVVEELKRVN